MPDFYRYLIASLCCHLRSHANLRDAADVGAHTYRLSNANPVHAPYISCWNLEDGQSFSLTYFSNAEPCFYESIVLKHQLQDGISHVTLKRHPMNKQHKEFSAPLTGVTVDDSGALVFAQTCSMLTRNLTEILYTTVKKSDQTLAELWTHLVTEPLDSPNLEKPPDEISQSSQKPPPQVRHFRAPDVSKPYLNQLVQTVEENLFKVTNALFAQNSIPSSSSFFWNPADKLRKQQNGLTMQLAFINHLGTMQPQSLPTDMKKLEAAYKDWVGKEAQPQIKDALNTNECHYMLSLCKRIVAIESQKATHNETQNFRSI